jgi:hypothetical protein
MSEKELRKMLEYASGFCEKTFTRCGEVAAMWHAVTASGKEFVERHPMELGKDLASALIRAQFELEDVVRYIFISEAWTVEKRTKDKALQEEVLNAARSGKLHQYPGRLEIVQLQGEDLECGQILAQRKIERPSGRKPFLGPLEILVEPKSGIESRGRMVGMLPVRATRQ